MKKRPVRILLDVLYYISIIPVVLDAIRGFMNGVESCAAERQEKKDQEIRDGIRRGDI